MEMTSAVMRFALATYLMKTGGTSRAFQSSYKSPWPSPTYKPSLTSDTKEEGCQDGDLRLSHVLTTHVSNLRQLLMEQRLQDWMRGVNELREFVTANNDLLGTLVEVLVKMIKSQKQDMGFLIQGELICDKVIEHMCFETNGEPSTVFDQLVETMGHYSDDQHITVVQWVGKAVDVVMHRLWQYHEQRFGTTSVVGLNDKAEH